MGRRRGNILSDISLNIPFFLSLFQFQKLSLINILICSLVVGLTSIIWFEIYKLFKLRKEVLL